MKIHVNRNRALVGAGVLAVTFGIVGALAWNADSDTAEPSMSIPDLTSLGVTEAFDSTAAQAAIEEGRPVLIGLPDGPNEACHSLLLVPDSAGDGGSIPFIYNHSGPKTEGAPLDREGMNAYGCISADDIDIPRKVDPHPAPLPHQLDVAAMTAAAAEGLPFLVEERYGNRVYVVIDGETWWGGEDGLAGPEGVALSRDRA